MVLADAMTGEILGEVGSANYFDASRSGWIDMTRTLRSPGSTLKPFIYGLAMEEGLIAQETLIEDRPADFAGYRPKNFDMTYQGDVTIRQALQLSLNVPAIRLLDAVGPQRLVSRFRQAGVTPTLPSGEMPGLAIGLGGVGITLRDLVQLYTGLSNGGKAKALRDGSEVAAPASARQWAPHHAASPTRQAPPTATATPGRSAMMAAMCWAFGSAAPIPARCPAFRATNRRLPFSSRDSSAPALLLRRFAARPPAPSAPPMATCL
jgi:membrane carboxypeptidase/penicillin-binding protein PbpC